MHIVRQTLACLPLCLAFTVLVSSCAQSAAAESARAILDRRTALEDGERHWTDRHQRLRMRISGKAGQRERELDVYERHYPHDELKAIVFLRGPEDVRNVAFLSIGPQGRAAEQWLYLPNTKRVRKITVSARDEPFVSSDLTFHDLDLLAEMTSWSEKDATSTLRAEEPIDATPCYAIELRPQRDDIGYQRIVLWLGREDLVPRQVDFHERDAASGWLGSLVGGEASDEQPTKRVRQRSIELAGMIPVARRIEIETPAKGSHTEIDIVAVELDQSLPDDLFSQRALEQGPGAAGK